MTRTHARRALPARVAAAIALTGGIAAGAVPLAVTAAAAPACSVDLTVSNRHPVAGQNITLRWKTTGADQLVASWTSADVPFSGTQVTTEQLPGPVSYQVTALKSGQYCGGAMVAVVYTAVASSVPSSSVPSAPSSSASSASSDPTSSEPTSTAPTTASTTATSSSPSAPATSAPPSTQVNYPAQSPTGGSSTPWYARPANLLALGLISLFGSIALVNRERIRAVFARRH